MLRLFLNGDLFWSARISECLYYSEKPERHAIYSLKISKSIDGVGSMSFSILRTHPMYSKIKRKRSTFLLHDNGTLFFGKVSSISETYNYQVNITVEDIMAVFEDDCYRQYSDKQWKKQKKNFSTVDKIINHIIETYNRASDSDKRTAGLNSSWHNPDDSDDNKKELTLTKGLCLYSGSSKSTESHDFDIRGQSYYDILYSTVLDKVDGFFRIRVKGRLVKTGSHVIGFHIQKLLFDYLTNEADFRIDPDTGVMYDYEEPIMYESAEIDGEIMIDGTYTSYETDVDPDSDSSEIEIEYSQNDNYDYTAKVYESAEITDVCGENEDPDKTYESYGIMDKYIIEIPYEPLVAKNDEIIEPEDIIGMHPCFLITIDGQTEWDLPYEIIYTGTDEDGLSISQELNVGYNEINGMPLYLDGSGSINAGDISINRLIRYGNDNVSFQFTVYIN